MEALSEAKKWRAVALLIAAAVIAYLLILKPPIQPRMIALTFGLLAALTAAATSTVLNNISGIAPKRSAKRLIAFPVLLGALIFNQLEHAVQAGTMSSQLQYVWGGAFVVAGLVIVIAAMRIEMLVETSKAAAATTTGK